MSTFSDNLIKLLSSFDLSSEESKVYLFLLEKGSTSVLELSRKLSIARTKVYRLSEKLIQKGLITEKVDYLGHKLCANSPKNLEILVNEKLNEVNRLKSSLPVILNQLSGLEHNHVSESKILYYKGIEGLKQVTWNSLKAKGELLTMEVNDMNEFLDNKFAEKVRREIVDRKVFTRNLTNRSKIPAWTKVKEAVTDFWDLRYIDPKDFEITFDILIYNDVYCIYDYQDENIFCVEIYNEKLVKMQKQIYEFIWNKARKMKIINQFGEAELL